MWEVTKGTIHLPLGCLQGGSEGEEGREQSTMEEDSFMEESNDQAQPVESDLSSVFPVHGVDSLADVRPAQILPANAPRALDSEPEEKGVW